MKKFICILMAIVMLLGMASCSAGSSKYYENTDYEKLKTFTKITGIEAEITEFIDSECATNYVYPVTADEKTEIFAEYIEYLKEYGFMGIDDGEETEVEVYIADGYDETLKIKAEETQITVSVPYDDATREERYSVLYKEITDACQVEDYSKVIEICDKYPFLDSYKEYSLYKTFANAMLYYEYGDYYNAALGLYEASASPELGEIATEHLNEITKYDGVYKKSTAVNGREYGAFYWYISYGAAGFGFASESSYNADDADYMLALMSKENTDGTSGVYAVTPDLTMIDFYKFELSGGNLVSTSLFGDSSYQNFEGVFTRVADAPALTRLETSE